MKPEANDFAAGAGSATVGGRTKILYLTHRVPYPPNRGDRIRSYHTLRYLAQRATVDLACLADEPVDEETGATLQRLCRRVAMAPVSRTGRWVRALGSLACGRSATERLFYSPELFQTLTNWSSEESYDSVLAFCSSMAPYLRAGRLPQTPAVIDLVDVDSQKWFDYAALTKPPLHWLYQLEGRRVRRLEQSLAARSRAICVVSEDEAGLLRKHCPHRHVYAIPNGVDLEYFAITPGAPKPAEVDCLFVGALDYRANIDGVHWFCREVWPEVSAVNPLARLRIVGRRPAESVLQLSGIHGVEVIADVPDVRPYLRATKVVIVPLRIARGIQNKLLEALAAAVPVIASPQAIEGLEVVAGEHVCRAEAPNEWIAAICRLIAHPDARGRLGNSGYDFVCRHHRWESCLQPLGDLLQLPKDTERAAVPVLA